MSTNSRSHFPYISKILLSDIPPFTERVELKLNPSVNIFIGPNSTGKTTVLKLLKSRGPARRFGFLNRERRGNFFSTLLNKENEQDSEVESIDEVPLIWIPANRVPLLPDIIIPEDFARAEDEDELDELMNLDDESDSPTALFAVEVSSMVNAYFEGGNSDLIENAYEVGERALYCLKDICVKPQIVTAEFPFHFVDHNYIEPQNPSRFRRRTIPVLRTHYLMGLDVIDDPNSRIYAGNLSSGVQDLYIWLLYMGFRLANFYSWQIGWHERPGVLLIDEIENHLHPNWQRRVIDALREHFPGLQVFATTHSPFLVSGRKAGEVHMCTRNEEGTVVINPLEDDVFSWSADEILSEFMEVEYPTDTSTENAVRVVLWLEDIGELDGNAEPWRLSQIEQFEAEVDSGEATDAELIVLKWLRGEFSEPINLRTPLVGDAEQWRLRMIDELRDETGANIFAGGFFSAQREMLRRYEQIFKSNEGGLTEEDGA